MARVRAFVVWGSDNSFDSLTALPLAQPHASARAAAARTGMQRSQKDAGRLRSLRALRAPADAACTACGHPLHNSARCPLARCEYCHGYGHTARSCRRAQLDVPFAGTACDDDD